jgi:signal transduction histidine kinase
MNVARASDPVRVTARQVAARFDEAADLGVVRRSGVLVFSIAIIALLMLVSASTHNSDLGYVTILLCPLAIAALAVWDWRWQLALNLASLILYAVAELSAPPGQYFAVHHPIGIAAGLTLAQLTAVFRGRKRRRLKAQLHQLVEAGDFRETQIAAMTHDIRSPLATLVGLVSLLAEGGLDEPERANLLARLGSNTASMDLMVKNMLDLYLLEEQRMQPFRRVINADSIVSETAERYAVEARLRGIKLTVELGGVTDAHLDALHLERIVANLVTSAIRRIDAGEVRFRTAQDGGWMTLEVNDTGPAVSPMEIEHILDRPNLDENGARSAALGRYIVRSLVEADGGETRARSSDGLGLSLIVRLPISQPSA